MLRASSLVAVTSLVWSMSDSLAATAWVRTAWRTRTTSASLATVWVSVGRCSPSRVVIVARTRWTRPLRSRGQQPVEQVHAPVDVEGGADAGQVQPQLDQGDGDGRLHADEHGLGVEHA